MSETSVAGPRDAGDAAKPFHDLEQYVALPRLSGLALSPDGTRLVTSVADARTPSAPAFVTALWEVDPAGEAARPPADPQRARASAPWRSPPAATCCSPPRARTPTPRRPTTTRPRPCGCCPAGGGEARVVGTRAGRLRRASRAPRRRHGRRARADAARRRRPARTTSSGARRARTARSRRSCTPATRSATGTTTSAPTSRACSPARSPTATTRPTLRRDLDAGARPRAATRPTSDARPRRPHRRRHLARRRPQRRATATVLRGVDVATGERRDAGSTTPAYEYSAPRISPDGAHGRGRPRSLRRRPERPPRPTARRRARRPAGELTDARAGLGPLAGRRRLDARRQRAARHRRRRRPRPGVPRRASPTARSSA